MALGAALVGAWLVIVFAGIVSRADELEATADQARRARDMLVIQAELVEDEIEFVRSDAFVRQAAREQGLGEAGERAFRLPDDAPTPAPIVPLGAP
jgi:hypothetical protein